MHGFDQNNRHSIAHLEPICKASRLTCYFDLDEVNRELTVALEGLCACYSCLDACNFTITFTLARLLNLYYFSVRSHTGVLHKYHIILQKKYLSYFICL